MVELWVVGGPTTSDTGEAAAPVEVRVVLLSYAATTVLQPHMAASAAIRCDRLIEWRNAHNKG